MDDRNERRHAPIAAVEHSAEATRPTCLSPRFDQSTSRSAEASKHSDIKAQATGELGGVMLWHPFLTTRVKNLSAGVIVSKAVKNTFS
jgi:hypothetical protein